MTSWDTFTGERFIPQARAFPARLTSREVIGTNWPSNPRTRHTALSARIAKPAMPRFDGLEQVCPKSAPPASVTDRPSAHVKDGVVGTC